MYEEEDFNVEIIDQETINLYKKVASLIRPTDTVLELNGRDGYFAGNFLAFCAKDFLCLIGDLKNLLNAQQKYPGIKSKFRKFLKTELTDSGTDYNTVVALDMFQDLGLDLWIFRKLKPDTKLIFTLPGRITSSDIYKRYRNLLDIVKSEKFNNDWLLYGWKK